MKKTRSLGLTAALAASFVALFGVGNALASQLTASAYPVTVSVTQSPGSKIYFSGGGVSTGCQGIETLAGLSEASPSLGASPFNGGSCAFFGEHKIAYNGCQVTFNFGSDAGHFGRYDGTMDIGPANCGPIELTKGSTLCVISLPAQSGLYVSFENAGGSVTANLDATGVKYTLSGACGSQSGSNGMLTGTLNLDGWEADLLIEEEAHSPLFEAEKYPALVTGTAVGQHVFKSPTITNSCKKAGFVAYAPSAPASITVEPGYDECMVAGIPALIQTNGCTYEFHLGSKIAAGRYSGTADIDCPTGKAIESVSPPSYLCTWKVPAQSGLSGVEFINDSSSGHRIEVKASLTGIKYTQTANSIFCPVLTGSFSNGTLTGTTMVEGTKGNGIRVGG